MILLGERQAAVGHIYITDTKRRTGWTCTLHGVRGGWAYVTLTEGPSRGITTKVPSSWVREA